VKKGNWTTDRPHNGLDNPYLGLYQVLSNLYSNVYKVNLPPSIKAKRFFNANRLIKAKNDPIPGQFLPSAEPVIVNRKLE
jgi:hypothetical protein